MPMHPNHVYVVSEGGINAHGSIENCLKMIEQSKHAGCDAFKLQKRDVDTVYTKEELEKPRESKFGTTNGELKRALEFSKDDYDVIVDYCKELAIDFYVSPWDEKSVDFIMQYDVPYIKIASASATDKGLLKHCCATGVPLLVSTGMCEFNLVRRIVNYVYECGGEIACLYHTTSTYPCSSMEVNLSAIQTLRGEFPGLPIGYSGHDVSPITGVMAACLGAASVERHFTLNRSMEGSDQASSLEKRGMQKMVSDIRLWETARGNGAVKVFDSELPIIEKLRRKDDF